MNVLVLTQYYWPESFRINEIVESLQQAGCTVTVLTGQPNYPEGTVFPGYRATGFGIERHPGGYSIARIPMAPRGKASALRLVANYLSFVASASTFGLWLLRGQRFDVVFVYAVSPILQAIPGIAIKRVKKAALVTWVQDLWPQSLSATGFIHNRHALNLVTMVVRWIYRRSDLLLTQSRAFIPTVRAMAGDTPVAYHPNPGELAFDQPVANGEPALSLPAGFNVVFAGNLGTVQALDTVLDAAELLKGADGVRIVLVGSGSREQWLKDEAARRGLDNVLLPGRFPPEAMPAILQQAAAVLVSLARDPVMEQTIPSKVQAYLAAGKPIIAALDGEGARVVLEAGAGIASAAEDAQGLAAAIMKLRVASPEALQEMGRAGRRYYDTHFSPALLAHELVGHFRATVGHPDNGACARTGGCQNE
jgi:glycosyltransferase involved in cell wall biosynthesis